MVWQVPHCCLNSAAPSGGFAAGSGHLRRSNFHDKRHRAAKSQPHRMYRAQLCHKHHRWREPSLGRRQQGGGSSGLFYEEQKTIALRQRADAAARRLQSSKPPEPRLALTSLRRFLPSSRRCFEPSVGLVGAARGRPDHGFAQAIRAGGRWRRRGCAPGCGSAAHGSRSRRPWSCAGRRAGRAAPRHRPASAIRRVSNRNCAAVESLLTFCPPGPGGAHEADLDVVFVDREVAGNPQHGVTGPG